MGYFHGRMYRVVIALFGLFGVSGCLPHTERVEPAVLSLSEPMCDFSLGPCVQEFDGLTLSLNTVPYFAPSEQPVRFELQASDVIENVDVSLAGRDMYMGYIPVSLKEKEPQLFQGQVTYGRCASDYMVWRVSVRFTHQQQKQVVWFDFIADAPQTAGHQSENSALN